MAVVWSKKIDNNRYEVRTAGKTTRLFTNGVFHSQYNSRTKSSNGIWDLLALPAFFQKKMERVLMLGVGGGAAIRILLDYFLIDEIVGVEFNETHIHIANNYFGLQQAANVELVLAEADEWLSAYKGPRFDLIIEDLFTELDGEPIRAINFSQQWFNRLEKVLSPEGMLVANFISKNDFKKTTVVKERKKYKAKYAIHYFSDQRYDNCIAVFRKRNKGAKEFGFIRIPSTISQVLECLPAAYSKTLANVSVGTISR